VDWVVAPSTGRLWGVEEGHLWDEEMLFGAKHTTDKKDTIMGLCMECALRRHDFHELLGKEAKDEGLRETPLPQALIDGRPHVLLSYAWTHRERCSECKRKAANLYLPII
jgi:hypothetical protein